MPPKEAFEGAIAKMQSRQTAIMATVKNCSETVVEFEPFEYGFIGDPTEPKPSITVAEDISSDEEPQEELSRIVLQEALGESLTQIIKEIRSTKAMKKPTCIISTPRPHQLVGAARIMALFESKFQGGFIGDTMGMGKTLTSILVMIASILAEREKPTSKKGPWVVVTKKSLIPNWLREISENVSKDAGIRVLALTPKHTATDLYDWDIIVTNYETVMSQFSAKKRFEDRTSTVRPQASLFSDIHMDRGVGFGVVLDEAQFIKYAQTKTHEACYALHRYGTMLLTGTMLDNRWQDIYGLLRMMEGHPFHTPAAFTSTFGDPNGKPNKDPKPSKSRRLVKLLIALSSVRPESILDLPNITVSDKHFTLTEKELAASNNWTAKYENAIKMAKEKKRRNDKTALKYIIKAMQEAIHLEIVRARPTNDDALYGPYGLAAEESDEEEPEEDGDEDFVEDSDGEYNDGDSSPKDAEDQEDAPRLPAEESREAWIERITEAGTAHKSERMKEFLDLFRYLQHEYPTERIAVTSERTKVLDLVAIILHQEGKICVQYDGRVKYEDREHVLRSFQTCTDGSRVLLITPGTGGTGLNIPEASIMIQIELWWNLNVEKQMRGRFHRQGQQEEVKIFRLISNAKVDKIILENQENKERYNEGIMKALICHDSEHIEIPTVFERRVLDAEEEEVYRLDPATLRQENHNLAAKRTMTDYL